MAGDHASQPPGGGDAVTIKIARFTSLNNPVVAEVNETTWDAWLKYLAEEHADEFRGQFQHSGWSPVVFDPPQRANANVRKVLALVLDYDKHAQWDEVHSMWLSNYGVMYTTKGHRDDAHRFRVVMPLNRPVTPEEYAKIWRWAAERSSFRGCPVDPQCKDPARFWYDPTRPIGTWRSQMLTGQPVDPEPILALPEAPPTLRIVEPPSTPRSDEREKRARAYLAKIPGAVAGDAGHTATFNAVAAVMIGFDLDEGTTRRLIWNDYNPRCDPPWSERELEHKLASVAKQCKRERGYLLRDRPQITDARSAAAHAPDVSADVTVDWRSLIRRKPDGVTPRRWYTNTATFIRCHPDFRCKWSLDTMTNMPWFDGAPISSGMVHELRSRVETDLGYTPAVADIEAAINAAAAESPFHPIRQYLRSVDWDHVPRLRSMARDYLGTDDPLHAEMVEKFMIGAARRAIEPGCKLDTALMLVGAQGIGKSTFFSILGGAWHADSFVDITNKDSFVQIHSAWIYELSELENVVTGRAESRLKAWLTSTHDMYRAPYARVAERRARAVVICGTTNRAQFITDDTGSRRFWIVPVIRRIDRDLLTQMRGQLWAEAYAAAERGAEWWLSGEADAARERASDEHREHDEWHDRIAEYLAAPTRDEVTIGELLENVLDIKIAFADDKAQKRAAKALALLGWKRQREGNKPRRWKYLRPGRLV